MTEPEYDSSSSIKKPSMFWLATEGQRALLEWTSYYPYKLLKNRERTGDGHAVLVLPGFMASDISTAPLRSFLKNQGYNPYGWGSGRNYGSEAYLHRLIERVEDIYLTHRSKVSLVGWSLGGVFAREIAKVKPKLIRQIITLGSPFGGITEPNNAMWIYEILTDGRGTEDVDPELLSGIPEPAPVPTTAIYSKEDGVVHWKTCIEKVVSPIHQNVRVRGSHLGLGVNPSVLKIIKNRLQLNHHNWIPFLPEDRLRNRILFPVD